MPSVDNSLYDRMADSWWNERGFLQLLRTTINPWRVPYFQQTLAALDYLKPGTCLLDVGCGGGLLSEEFAKMDLIVIGIDPSEHSLEVARDHASSQGLTIDYRLGVGDALPFGNDSFDVVSCCDVLEHIAAWDAVVAEISRVLKPGGVFLFDTINRTAFSWLVNIKIAQDWSYTRFVPKNLHSWRMFIKPSELSSSARRHGLTPPEFIGAKPRGTPIQALTAIREFRQGKITADDVGALAALRPSRSLSGSYMGHTVKSHA